MDTNDLNRRLRYALQLNDDDAVRLVSLGGGAATVEDIAAWRQKDDHPDFKECPDAVLHALLAGLILEHRGPPPKRQTSATALDTTAISSNTVIKRLKTALSMRTEDVRDCIAAGGGKVSNSEVSSLLRRADARNYRSCGDQMLRRFLTGLGHRQRNDTT